jgi:hypothetical protein
LFEILSALALLAWRFRQHPVSMLWRDWVTLLCLLWIAAALTARTRAWPAVMGAFMTGLLALYSWGQLPLTLRALGVLR